MYLNVWLIGNDTEHVLDDLTAPDGHPSATTWIPLDAADENTETVLPDFRSAYAFRDSHGEQWIDFALPPSVIRDSLGPRAMIHPKQLARGKALRSNVKQRDGVLMVKVPRYFETFGSAWTFEQVGRDPLITRGGQETGQTTVGNLDLSKSFRLFSSEPVVIIDEGGPRLFARHRDSYYNVAGMTRSSAVLESIANRPPDTPVRCAWCTF